MSSVSALNSFDHAHLGVDYFVGKFDPGVAKNIAIVSLVLVLFFAVAVFLVGGGNVSVYRLRRG